MSRLKKRAKINVPFLQQEMSIWDKNEKYPEKHQFAADWIVSAREAET